MSIAINKEKIHALALTHLLDKIKELQGLIADTQESGNNETKSSAGDKHETSRAHAQIETERLSKQLSELNQQYMRLKNIPLSPQSRIQLGSYIITEKGHYFMTVGMGSITTPHGKCFLISPQSPVGTSLIGKQANEAFEMPNGVKNKVLAVY